MSLLLLQPIRGGNRSVPTSLFGGPALCMGCVSISSRSSESCIDSSMAYFYTSKSESGSAAQFHGEKGLLTRLLALSCLTLPWLFGMKRGNCVPSLLDVE